MNLNPVSVKLSKLVVFQNDFKKLPTIETRYCSEFALSVSIRKPSLNQERYHIYLHMLTTLKRCKCLILHQKSKFTEAKSRSI